MDSTEYLYEKKGWLYVGKLNSKKTVDNIKMHLNSLYQELMVKERTKHVSNTSTSKSFKIGFKFDLVEEVVKSDIWPEGSIIKP